MKKKFISIASILATAFLTACSDFLETPPSVDYGEDEVFATRVGVEKLLTTLYAEGMPYGFCMSSSNTDRRLLPVMRAKMWLLGLWEMPHGMQEITPTVILHGMKTAVFICETTRCEWQTSF